MTVETWLAVICQIARGLILLASAAKHTEPVLDSLWNIEPMKLGVQKSRQTTVTFPATTDDTCGDAQQSTPIAACWSSERYSSPHWTTRKRERMSPPRAVRELTIWHGNELT